MAGYLDQYGAGEEQRERLIKWIVLSALVALIIAGILYFIFRNYRQERQVKEFFQLLRNKDYQAAYRLWGCAEPNASPCRDYPFAKFMEDWGPTSPNADVTQAKVTKSRSCGTGVIVTAQLGREREERFWVERRDLTIGFSPWPGCPPR